MKRWSVWVLLTYSLSFAGIDSGGGNAYEIDFKSTGNLVVQRLEEGYLELPVLESVASKLKEAVSHTQVQMSDQPLYLNGVRRDAINYPSQKLIVVDQSAYRGMLDLILKSGFVLHEYLGIIGANDQDYSLSNQFMAALQKDYDHRWSQQLRPKLKCNQEELGGIAAQFLNRIKFKNLQMGLSNGEIADINFKVNAMGTITATLVFPENRGKAGPLPIWECVDTEIGASYLLLYGDRRSPVGTYKYELFVLIPLDRRLLAQEIVPSYADLRWGTWEKVKLGMKPHP